MSRSICFLSMDAEEMTRLGGDDDLEALSQLSLHKISVEFVDWHDWKTINWSRYLLVIIRSTWDYHHHPNEFLVALDAIQKQVPLQTPLHLVKENANKIYLKTLLEKGIPIVPTKFISKGLTWSDIEPLYSYFGVDKLVIKPQVGLGSVDTYVLRKNDPSRYEAELACFLEKDAMIQPFRESIQVEGEYSLILFNGLLSHCILKTPQNGDFRSQKGFGAIQREHKADDNLKALAEDVMRKIGEPLLYSRVDFIRNPDGLFELMELEIIESSFFFSLAPGSGDRFADAVNDWLLANKK